MVIKQKIITDTTQKKC